MFIYLALLLTNIIIVNTFFELHRTEMDKRLTEWFLEAKHSLSIAGPICTEANGLVATSRKQIEKATVLWSQIMFLHSAISEQLDMLKCNHR